MSKKDKVKSKRFFAPQRLCIILLGLCLCVIASASYFTEETNKLEDEIAVQLAAARGPEYYLEMLEKASAETSVKLLDQFPYNMNVADFMKTVADEGFQVTVNADGRQNIPFLEVRWETSLRKTGMSLMMTIFAQPR